MSINNEGDQFEVICKRCGHKFTVVRNWGGGIRRDGRGSQNSNPAKCNCGSRSLEVF